MSGMSVPSMFYGCRVCRGNLGIPTRTTAASACPVTLFGVEVALTAVEAAELFASGAPGVVPWGEDARRRLARKHNSEPLYSSFYSLPRRTKLSPSLWQHILCPITAMG